MSRVIGQPCCPEAENGWIPLACSLAASAVSSSQVVGTEIPLAEKIFLL